MAGQHSGRLGQIVAVLLLGLLTASAQGRRGSNQTLVIAGLATATQGARDSAGQSMQPVGVAAHPQCSATIVYSASVGDSSRKETADLAPFVGSFDVVVTQPQVSAAVARHL
jgi:hypothetical protein